jgi:WD40 repeat protein
MTILGKCEQILKGHTDAVRGLAVISSSLFLTCSNDATVRQWNVSGSRICFIFSDPVLFGWLGCVA